VRDPPKPDTSYWHRQVGLVSVLSLGAVVAPLFFGPTNPIVSVLILVFSVVGIFKVAREGTLAVRVGDEFIEWWIGLGVLAYRVPLSAVARVDTIPVRFTARGMPEGAYYGASMQYFVELSLTDGSRAVLRSSEPTRLVDEIERRMAAAPRLAAEQSFSHARSRVLEVRSSGARLAALLLITAAPIVAHELLSPWVRIKGCLRAGTRWHLTYVCPKEVTHVEILDELPQVERRLESYALGWNPPGRVVLAGWGEVELYLSQPWPPYVLVRSEQGTLILNTLWPARTQRLYQRLSTWPEVEQ